MLNQRQPVIAKVHVVTVDKQGGRAIAAALNKLICVCAQSIFVFLIVDGAKKRLAVEANAVADGSENPVIGDIGCIAIPVRFEHVARVSHQSVLLLCIESAPHGLDGVDGVTGWHSDSEIAKSRPVLKILEVVIQAAAVFSVEHFLAVGVNLLVHCVEYAAHQNRTPANRHIQSFRKWYQPGEGKICPGA